MASTIQYTCFPRLSPAIVVVAAACICLPGSEKKVLAAVDAAVDRSPVDLCLTADQRWIVTINQIANSVSLVRRADSKVVDEVACGQHPADIAITPAGQVLVTASSAGQLQIFEIEQSRLKPVRNVPLGMQPHGIAVSPAADVAYVSQLAAGKVVAVKLSDGSILAEYEAGTWPRYLTLSPDGTRLVVGNSGSSEVVVIDTESGERTHRNRLTGGINLGHVVTSADGEHAYFPWMVYRTNPITEGNIRRGWVLASRIARVRLDEYEYREAISLDVPGQAVADPHGIVISEDGQRLVVSSSGTHELLVYRLPDLPFVGLGGPGDLMDRSLQKDRERFRRIAVGGRPLGMQLANDGKTLFVANYLRNSVQQVDLDSGQITTEIDLGGPETISAARRGMEIFYDATRSLDQWYSCHSCHQDGGTNARAMDTWNDGTEMTYKTVLPLHNVERTFPWTWHGWQNNLSDAMHKSITSTMQGEPPSSNNEQALIAFLKTLQVPPNPHRSPDGELTESASRGKQIFFSRKGGCIDCHNGPYFTDGKIHDVGTGSDDDAYDGYNTPSLVGTYRKVRWLHNGRAKDLRQLIEELHRPEDVNGEGGLTTDEVDDLIDYLKSL